MLWVQGQIRKRQILSSNMYFKEITNFETHTYKYSGCCEANNEIIVTTAVYRLSYSAHQGSGPLNPIICISQLFP